MFFAGIYTFAQAPTGTLAGRVVDPTGAAIPGAQIVITNQRTGVKRVLLIAANRDYKDAAPFLGNYEVAA